MMTDKVTDGHRERGAVVYVRQSTMTQVLHNRESQRRQYDLEQYARTLGFLRVEVIDDDLGRSASGSVDRPGFQRLVAAVCAGALGAILCLEASRLARNGRDWHHLIELCALVGVLLIDPDGVYDPRLVNDRLLLGMKGTMSEFELTLFRQRSRAAIDAKAKRGALEFGLAVGLRWTEDGKIELDPDERIQHALRTVFAKFIEFGSIRQVLMWLREAQWTLPVVRPEKGAAVEWNAPVYRRVLAILRNPFYAGAYAFGQRVVRTTIKDGRAHRSYGHWRPQEEWTALLRDHHPGYISWEQFERNQQRIEENAHCHGTRARKAARGGTALLGGLLRCARCGRMLHVVYQRRGYARYECRYDNRSHGAPRCISFGNLFIDDAVGRALIDVVQPRAVQAALDAISSGAHHHAATRRAVDLQFEQARHDAALAARRYEAVDPTQRLVAAELERRWNSALTHMAEIEGRRAELDAEIPASTVLDPAVLLMVGADLQGVWNDPATDMALKQRVARVLLKEIIVNVDEAKNELVLVLHWSGGRHSELGVPRRRPGDHRNRTGLDAESVIRRMAGEWTDRDIAATLNKLGLRTGVGNTWTESRVSPVRERLALPSYDPTLAAAASELTLNQAADRLGVGPWIVRKLLQRGVLEGRQPVAEAPWQIATAALDTPAVRAALTVMKGRRRGPGSIEQDTKTPRFPGI